MKIILWIIGVIAALGVAAFVFVFVNMIFISSITEIKQKLGLAGDGLYRADPLLEGIQFTELKHDRPPLPYDYSLFASGMDTGDLPGEFTLLDQGDGRLIEGQAFFDDQVKSQRKAIEFSVTSSPSQYCLIADGDELFYGVALADEIEKVEGQKDRTVRVRRISTAFTQLSHWGFSGFSYWAPIDENHFLMVATEQGKNHWDDKLWQINRHDLSKTFLADKPYYTHSTPPKVYRPEGFEGSVLVHFTGSLDYAFGGDASRPKYSTVRIFTPQYPNGQDIARIGFKAGMVVGVSYVEGQLELLADPSLPAMADKPRVPPRIWRVALAQ